MDEVCEHKCEWHPPVETHGLQYRQVWVNREVDAMQAMRVQLDELDEAERRRTLAWLTDYFAEVVS